VSQRKTCPSCGAFLDADAKKCAKCGTSLKDTTIIKRVSTLITEAFIAEETYDPPGLPKFTVYDFAKDLFSTTDEVDLQEIDEKGRKIIYQPILNDHLKKGMVILPRKPVECRIADVIKESFEFVLSGFDSCGKDLYVKLEALSAISSWILDKEKPTIPIAGIGVFAPILAIRGPSGSGKNRLANLLRFLSYHPFFDVSTYRIPSLYRPLDMWKGTLVVDEGDLSNTNENSELTHFLNARATGTPIGRQNPDNPSKSDAFESFGVTIITQRRHFEDNATEGRTLPYTSDISTNRSLPTLETEDMISRGRDLQDKLLYLRMKYWQQITVEKTLWIENVSDHRLNSALLPIMALSKQAPMVLDIVKDIIVPIAKERKKVKAQSDDGIVVNALWDKIDEGLWRHHNHLYFVLKSSEVVEIDGKEDRNDTPLISSSLAEELKPYTAKRIRTILHSLNITPDDSPELIRIGKKNYKPIIFDPGKLEKRLREFVIDYEANQLYDKLGIKALNVTDVTLVTDFLCDEEKDRDENKEINPPEAQPHIVTVTSVTSVTPLCGKCQYHKTKDCTEIHPELILPTATYAENCPRFSPKEETL